MSLQDVMKADMPMLFADFGVDVVYAPIVPGMGTSPRTIKAIMESEIDPEFETGSADLDFDVARVRFQSVNDSAGIVTVSEQGRGTAGDTFVLNSVTWHVKKNLSRPNDAATYEHVLVCSTGDAPLPDHFG